MAASGLNFELGEIPELVIVVAFAVAITHLNDPPAAPAEAAAAAAAIPLSGSQPSSPGQPWACLPDGGALFWELLHSD